DGEKRRHARLHRSHAADRRYAALPGDKLEGVSRRLRILEPRSAHPFRNRRLIALAGCMGILDGVHGFGACVVRWTLGETVPESRRSPPPSKPLLTMQPVSFPRRRINRRAT